PPSRTISILPPLTTISTPATAPVSRVVRRNRDTLAILGNASPRNPNVATACKSAAERILLVAWRSSESSASSRSIPQASSITRTSEIPPRRITMSIFRAPASMLFSINSFTTEAGRSTTSPAATWLATVSGNNRMRLILYLNCRFQIADCEFILRPGRLYLRIVFGEADPPALQWWNAFSSTRWQYQATFDLITLQPYFVEA